MRIKIFYTLFIYLIIIANINSSYAQKSKIYKKEYCTFLKFIRNDMFKNLGFKYMPGQNDSIYILEYTSNVNLFMGTPFYGNIATNDLISEKEKLDVIKNIFHDSTKTKIKINCIDNCYLLPEIITKKLSSIIYRFSKPIFAKKYTICYFSIEAYIDNVGSQSSYLFQKNNGNWKLIKRIGGMYDY